MLTSKSSRHGTGTPVGDPIEVRAVSHALNDTRPKDKPLLVGAVRKASNFCRSSRSLTAAQVKPNIGHSEAASGIFAVMKASIMTETALIPGVAFFNKLNPNSKFENSQSFMCVAHRSLKSRRRNGM